MWISIISNDPSLRNWGIIRAKYNLITEELILEDYAVISHKDKSSNKQNIKDLATARFLYEHLSDWFKDVDAVCIELPHGSQSSRAMVSYATCIALYASLTAFKPFEVVISPYEVKRYIQAPDGSKEYIINWVKHKHPELNLPSKTKAEHICDAIITLYCSLPSIRKHYENCIKP